MAMIFVLLACTCASEESEAASLFHRRFGGTLASMLLETSPGKFQSRSPSKNMYLNRGALLRTLAAVPLLQSLPALAGSNPEAKITKQAVLTVKISNEPNSVARTYSPTKAIKLGLYGDAAPESVRVFEAIVQGKGTLKEIPDATYLADPANRLFPNSYVSWGEMIGDSSYFTKGGQVGYFDRATLLKNNDKNSLSFDRAGLLGMRLGGRSVSFCITTGADPTMNEDWIVIGEALTGFDVIDQMNKVPYLPDAGNVAGFLRKAGKAAGDSRAFVAEGMNNKPRFKIVIARTAMVQ